MSQNANRFLVLDPLDIVKLQGVCQRFLSIARDDALWRMQCFENSSFLQNLRRRRDFAGDLDRNIRESLQRVRANDGEPHVDTPSRNVVPTSQIEANKLRAKTNEKIRIMANWDPGYESEKVDYYSEYIQR